MQEQLEILAAENRLRHIPEEREGRLIDLCSNDYLGLSTQAALYREEYLRRFGDAPMSASASRLLAGRQRHFEQYESYLSELYNEAAGIIEPAELREALLFNSGYHANTGIMSALGALPATIILADKLIHASAIDGMKLAGCEFKRFRHNDTEQLRAIIRKTLDRGERREGGEIKRIIVAVEAVYSMDGDRAPLRELAAIKREYPEVILFVDEAHSFGVCGEYGLGLAEETATIRDIDILMATLGKAAASAGAFAICNPRIKSWLVNSARSLIFSTALPPAVAGWSQLMTEVIVKSGTLRQQLQERCKYFSRRLEEATGELRPDAGHIQPLLTGDAAKALALSSRLREAGYDVLAIRRPTVPPGGERLRFSLNATLDTESLEPLFEIIADGLRQ